MKKFFVIVGMAIMILCVCTGCNVTDNSIDNNVEEVVDATLMYIVETYGEDCTSCAYGLNDRTRTEWQPLFYEDLSECEVVIVVYDANDEIIDLFAVNY